MTPTDNSPDGDKDVSDAPIETIDAVSCAVGAVSVDVEPEKELEVKVQAYPDQGAADLIIQADWFNGRLFLEAEEARALATALHAAADKAGHVPADDAPQPAEL